MQGMMWASLSSVGVNAHACYNHLVLVSHFDCLRVEARVRCNLASLSSKPVPHLL